MQVVITLDCFKDDSTISIYYLLFTADML